MSLSQYELAQIVEALDTIRKRLDALEAAQTDAFHVAQLVYLEQQKVVADAWAARWDELTHSDDWADGADV
mgnify:CR=1 FL=1